MSSDAQMNLRNGDSSSDTGTLYTGEGDFLVMTGVELVACLVLNGS
jgi:hypothetical protein